MKIGVNPVITLGFIGIVCTVSVWFLNETLGKDLLDEIEEMTKRYSIRYI